MDRWIERSGAAALSLAFGLALFGCGKDAPSTPPPPQRSADTVFTLPFTESFEGTGVEIEKRWRIDRNMAWPWVAWALDTTRAATGKQSVGTPLLSAYESGYGCGGSPYSRCFASAMVSTKKPVDLRGVGSASLVFRNLRLAQPTTPSPGCWSDMLALYGIPNPNAMEFRVVWVPARQTNVFYDSWNPLVTFSTGTNGWHEERVRLDGLVGQMVHFGFWQAPYCVDVDSTSAGWWIDEVVVTGEQ